MYIFFYVCLFKFCIALDTKMLVKVYNTVKVWLANIMTTGVKQDAWREFSGHKPCWVPLIVDKKHNDSSYMGHRPKIYRISQLFLHSLFVIF